MLCYVKNSGGLAQWPPDLAGPLRCIVTPLPHDTRQSHPSAIDILYSPAAGS